MSQIGYVYILHLDHKLKHAGHYVGWSKYPEKRLQYHKSNDGAKFTKACNLAGIDYKMVVCVQGDIILERRIKNTNNTKKYCPVCMGEKVRSLHLLLGEN